MRDTCDIFNCKYQSLARWVKTYKQKGNLNRKTRKNHNLKYVRKYITTTLWELSKLVNDE